MKRWSDRGQAGVATPGELVTGGFSEEVVPGLEFQDPGMQRGFWAEGIPGGGWAGGGVVGQRR